MLFSTAPTAAFKLLASARARREWLILQCDFNTGVALFVYWGSGLTTETYSHVRLQPGESIIFSRYGDMPWEGNIWVAGSGGTATYRGGEVYFE